MDELSKEYPMLHVYPQQKVYQPVVIKANKEGICVLINALISAIAQPESNGMASVFCGDAKAYEVIVKVVNTPGRFISSSLSN